MTSLGKVTKPGWCRGWFFAFGVPMGSLFWRGPWIRFGWVTRAWQIDDEKAWPSKIYHTFWIRFFPPNDVFKFIPSDLKKMAWLSRRATNESSKALRHLFLLKNWTFKSIYLSIYIYIIILYIYTYIYQAFLRGVMRDLSLFQLVMHDADALRCASQRFAFPLKSQGHGCAGHTDRHLLHAKMPGLEWATMTGGDGPTDGDGVCA